MNTLQRSVAFLLFATLSIPAGSRAFAQSLRSRIPAEWEEPESFRVLEEVYLLESQAEMMMESSRGGLSGKMSVQPSFVGDDGSQYALLMIRDGIPVYRKTTNAAGAATIGASSLNNELGLTGSNVEIGLWDAGKPYMHPEFGDRVEPADDGQTSNHTTHVAGTLIARGEVPAARGMAPSARVDAFDWNQDYLEMYSAAEAGLRVSNHSYDYGVGWGRVHVDGRSEWVYFDYWTFGQYQLWSYYWDWTMDLQPYYLMVKSASNEGYSGPDGSPVGHYHNAVGGTLLVDTHEMDCASGYACLGPGASSKNALVVGALDETGERVARFSSRGPTLDGRIKPDVVAPGTDVYSTIGPAGYGTMSGTSMATPMVTGSVALLHELENRLYGSEPRFLSSTIKGLLIHTADDLGQPGPDYHHGWGRVNLREAADLVVRDYNSAGLHIRQLQVSDTLTLDVFAAGGELKVTLVWTDANGPHPNTIADKEAPVLTLDYDLEVDVGGQTCYPFVLDREHPSAVAATGRNRVDNVEQVILSDAPTGPVTIRVIAPQNADSTRKVSLLVTGIVDALPTYAIGDPDLSSSTASALDVYPNPVRRGGHLSIRHLIDQPAEIQVEVFDLRGRKIDTIFSDTADGVSLDFDVPSDWPCGVLVLRFRAGHVHRSEKIVVI